MWRIWYGDGSIVSSDDCRPEDVPGYNVQAIVQPDPTIGTGNVGYLVLARPLAWCEWYYWRTDERCWVGAYNDRAMLDLIRSRQPIVGVSSSLQISDARFAAIYAEAEAWAKQQGLPPKSAFSPRERPD